MADQKKPTMSVPVSSAPGGAVAVPGSGKEGKRRSFWVKLVLFLLIAGTIGFLAYAEQRRRALESRLESTTAELEEIRRSTRGGGEELAKQVLEKVRRHMRLPDSPQPTVATIVDVEKLKQSSNFYQPAENGDHLVITDRRAILYDPDTDIILDVAPVRIDRTSASPTPAAGGSNASPQPSPSPSPAT